MKDISVFPSTSGLKVVSQRRQPHKSSGRLGRKQQRVQCSLSLDADSFHSDAANVILLRGGPIGRFAPSFLTSVVLQMLSFLATPSGIAVELRIFPIQSLMAILINTRAYFYRRDLFPEKEGSVIGQFAGELISEERADKAEGTLSG